jgi:DNA-binding transcriptional MerR regulator
LKELIIQIRDEGFSVKDVVQYIENHPKHEKKLFVLSTTGQTIKVRTSISGKRLAARISKQFDGLNVTAQEPN